MKIRVWITTFFFVFFTCVTVPKSNAGAFETKIARVAFRLASPYLIKTLGQGFAMLIGIPVGVGIGYLILTSGAVGVLAKWWQDNFEKTLPADGQTGARYKDKAGGISNIEITGGGDRWNWSCYGAMNFGISGGYYTNPGYAGIQASSAAMAWEYAKRSIDAFITGTTSAGFMEAFPSNSLIQSPVETPHQGIDIGANADIGGIFPPSTIFGTRGTFSSLPSNGAAVDSNVKTMTDAEALDFANKSGATEINESGQLDTPLDNSIGTVNINLKQLELNTAETNRILGIESTKLDNLVSSTINTSAKIDCVITTLTTSTVTSVTMASRLTNLKTIAMTKFPFSLAGGYARPTSPSFTGFHMPGITFANGMKVETDFMGVFSGLIVLTRATLAWLVYASTAFLFIRRGIQL